MADSTRLYSRATDLEDWADTIRHWRVGSSEAWGEEEILAFAEKALVYALDELRSVARQAEKDEAAARGG